MSKTAATSRRAGNHRGRKGKNGVYSAKHNDRNTKEQPEHINQDKIADNKIVLYGRDVPDITIDQHEQQVYEEMLAEALEKHNAKQIRNRHKNLCMDMQQARKNEKWCPEETVFTLSNADNPIDPELLWSVHQDYINWHLQQYPQCRLLDSAMHVDEANPHIHDRWLWLAQETDADGNQYNIVNQSRALEQMGVERPDPAKKTGRHNNAKMTYTADCRRKQIEIARSYGLDIEETPRDPSKSGLSHEKYILQQMQAEEQEIQAKMSAVLTEPRRLFEDSKHYEERVALTATAAEVTQQQQGIAEKQASLEQTQAKILDLVETRAQEIAKQKVKATKSEKRANLRASRRSGELIHTLTGDIPLPQRTPERIRAERMRGRDADTLQRRNAMEETVEQKNRAGQGKNLNMRKEDEPCK